MIPIAQRTVPGLLAGAVRSGPGHQFLEFQDERYTYADAARWTNAIVTTLSGAGIRAGTHVALVLNNSPVFVWCLLGLAQLGAIAVPINTEAKGPLLAHYLESSKSRHLIAESESISAILDAIGDLNQFQSVWVRDSAHAPSGQPKFRVLIDELATHWLTATVDTARGGMDLLALMFTSGTTGPSKAAMITHSQAVTTALIVADQLAIGRTDRMFTCLPLFHANAYWYTVLTALAAQATVVLSTRFSARRFWEEVATSRATEVNLMGSMMQILLKQQPSNWERDNDVRTVFVSPLPQIGQFTGRYKAQLATAYGLTETIPLAFSQPGEGYNYGGHAGRILDVECHLKVVDDEGTLLPSGSTGAVVVEPRSDGVLFRGYFGRPEDTADAWQSGAFRTGDIARVDSNGYLHFMGRRKDVIRRRGENIAAFDVEQMLCSDPRIGEAAAVPVPSELGEDDIALFLVPAEGQQLTTEEALDIAKHTLPRYMLPRFVWLVASLPKTPTSRVAKHKLIAIAREAHPELWASK